MDQESLNHIVLSLNERVGLLEQERSAAKESAAYLTKRLQLAEQSAREAIRETRALQEVNQHLRDKLSSIRDKVLRVLDADDD